MALDKMYCINCKKIFPDYMETRKAQSEITVGQFLYNQQRIMWDEPIKFTDDKKIFIINCPHCNSMNNVNATEIIEKMTQKRWKRDNKGINQYNKHINTLYKEIMTAYKSLNKMNNITTCGDKK